MNGVINAILKHKQEEGMTEKPEVVLILPNYTVYTAQLSNLQGKVTPRYVHTKRENHFLPTCEEIESVISPSTAAVVITYPNNPAQSTYEGDNVEELKKIVELCQENEVFLIADNIYQDLVFPRERGFTEIFNLTDRLDYVVKVYGCSKDTPFYSGYRTGYWFGDPRLTEKYKYMISSMENSLNTHSLVYFALNLYFKYKTIVKEEPVLEDMKFFTQGLFGWSQQVSGEELFNKMTELDLYQNYKTRIKRSNDIQEDALTQLIDFVTKSNVFTDYVNQKIGNVFFIKMNPDLHSDHDHAFFNKLFNEAKCGVLPGNVFGIPAHSNETWFRITLIHDHVENIIRNLRKIENMYTHQHV
nr:aminotransferase class I/II-fold pyridoxal phosphate-dependent enzyme [Metabacillus halosaccharovorans]